jgi:integration host factor subunit alpha
VRHNIKTIKRAHLQEAVQRVAGGSQAAAATIVEDVLEEMMQTLIRGEDVSLHSFGVFFVRSKPERLAHNLISGKKAILAARRVVQFRCSLKLLRSLNGKS